MGHRDSVAVGCMPISAPGRVEQSQRATWQEMCTKTGKEGQRQEQEGVKEKKAPLKWDGSSQHQPLAHLQPL